MRRVTFGGSDLATFVWSGPAAHIKIIFPEPGLGLDTVAMPEPDGPRASTMRTYTPRRFDPAALRAHAETFSPARFIERLRAIVAEAAGQQI